MSKAANPGFPSGDEGREMLEHMNGGEHEKLATWGLEYFNTNKNADILEIGCGGGANIVRLLKKCPSGSITGIDYSELSVEISRENNKDALERGIVHVMKGNVLSLPFDDESFDAATAFETIYFWQNLSKAFAQVYRVLKKGGTFFICNETDGEDPEGYDWEKENDNLKIYKIDEIKDFLREAGFSEIKINRKQENGWICFAATK